MAGDGLGDDGLIDGGAGRAAISTVDGGGRGTRRTAAFFGQFSVDG